MIDTHAHLYVEAFADDIEKVIESAKEAGVASIYLPNIDASTIRPMLNLVDEYPAYLFPMMGLHPGSVDADYKEALETVSETFEQHRFHAVGEIGLDYYWSTDFAAEQRAAFSYQLELAKDLSLPVAIHCREAFPDVLQALEDAQDGRLKGVLHCFTGNEEQAKRLLDIGFYIGVGGVATFTNSGKDLRQALSQVPLERIVLETDSPYLAPHPNRGKRNEPAFLKLVARTLSELYHLPLPELVERTTKNAHILFQKHHF